MPNSRMKILIFGAGAIGSAIGGFLSRTHEVTLLGRPAHLGAIRKRGLKVTGIWGNHLFRNFKYETNAAGISKKSRFDLILVTVKSYDTEAAARSIKKMIGPGTLVLPFQNGLGNIETLCRHLPPKQVLAGRVIFGVELSEPGAIKITVIAEPIAIGEIRKQKPTARVRKLVREFLKAGLPTVAYENVPALLWLKVVYNAALNPLASILGCHYGKLTEFQKTRMIMNEVIDEVYRVAGKAGVKLPVPTAGAYRKLFYSKLVPRTFDHHPSMLQDLEKGKKTEIQAICGRVAELGRKCGVKTPVNDLLRECIQSMERFS